MKLYAQNSDVPTYFQRMEGEHGKKFCEARKRIMQKYDTCPLCRELLKDGTILLLINNWKLFPNTIVHEACCDKFESKEDAIKYLHEDYQIALEHKHWFNVE